MAGVITANLAAFVEAQKKELMARNPELSGLDAHQQAIEFATKNPDVVKCYQMDAAPLSSAEVRPELAAWVERLRSEAKGGVR